MLQGIQKKTKQQPHVDWLHMLRNNTEYSLLKFSKTVIQAFFKSSKNQMSKNNFLKWLSFDYSGFSFSCYYGTLSIVVLSLIV